MSAIAGPDLSRALDRAAREVGALARLQRLDSSSWSTARAAILEAATALRSSAQVHEPPIDVDRILPLRKIVNKSFFNSTDSPEAVLVPTHQGFTIRLRPGLHPTRTKFSEAHEIAHTFFYDISKHPPQRLLAFSSSVLANRKEEGICNDFARELLMPLELVRLYADRFQGLSSWDLLQNVKAKFAVSTEVAARRLLSDCEQFQYCVSVFVDNNGHMRKWLGNKIKAPRGTERQIIDRVLGAVKLGSLTHLSALRHDVEQTADLRYKNGGSGDSMIIWLDFSRYRRGRTCVTEP